MRVLVACEFSGVVREAFRRKGHDAWSCDLLPTEIPGQHIQGDVLEILNQDWDLMIAHPPCTYLANSGIRWFNEERYGDKARERKRLRQDAFEFVMELYNSSIPRVCIENPVGWINSHFREADQTVQPYFFGDKHVKPTCLWLKNLPKLNHFYPEKPEPLGITYRKPSKNFKGGEIKKHYFSQLEPNRNGHNRSKTFPGIAEAMANQWGNIETLPIQLEWDQLNGK